MTSLHALYQAGEAALLVNMGALVEPVTKEDYLGLSGLRKQFPPSLFSHSDMQKVMHSVEANNAAAEGVLGRLVLALQQQSSPYSCQLYSLAGRQPMLEGASSPPDVVDPAAGMPRFLDYAVLEEALGNLTGDASESYLGQTFQQLLRATLRRSEEVGALLETTSTLTTFGRDSVSQQMEQVAKLVQLRDQLGSERDVFVVRRSGFDTHDTVDLSGPLGEVDGGLGQLAAELRAQGIWDNVAVLSVSDFGRTLTSNGRGTDHGWGGNHFLAGGAVRGGRLVGRYPDQLTDDGQLNIGRGRLIPELPWETVWNALAEWMGVAPEQMDTVLPLRQNFPADTLETSASLME